MKPPAALPARIVLVALSGLAAACGGALPTTDWTDPLPEPHPDSVEAVVFLIGDAGAALPGHSPVLARLAEDVEQWSRTLARDSAVAVFFLGDNVYPDGLHDRGDPEFVIDSLRLFSQVEVVTGPQARRFQTPAYFIAGNHDWGQAAGLVGLLRLRNQAELLEAYHAEGFAVDLIPEPGDPGPATVDIGRHARFIALDTHWWLQSQQENREDSVMALVAESIRTAGTRDIALAAHHPFVSGGSHGGPMPIWNGFGILWLLRKTGSLVQDLNSIPYRELRSGLREVFAAEGRPLLFAGGHDHSLQVLESDVPNEPMWSVVSGSGSKLTEVGPVRGLKWGGDHPGFMQLLYMRSGAVHLHVFMTGDDLGLCDEEDGPVDACMEAGLK